MTTVVSMPAYRERRDRERSALGRLDHAVERLDALVRGRGEHVTPTVERELRAIARAVADGSSADAADRAERLIGILQHPAASG
jgi:hypothetical protein